MNLQHAISTILPVASHTDNVGKGSTFVAIKGAKYNGIDYISTALERGANKIVIQNDLFVPENILNQIKLNNAELLQVNDARQTLAQLSATAWDFPSKKLKIIGVTGTKGKTTTTFLLNHLLSNSGYKTAMISGVENNINKIKYLANLTTPQPDYLHAFFHKCIQENVEYVIMESSAQAFSLKRLDGIDFNAAIFTNLDLEHMEFYSNMQEYFLAKCEIFKQLKEKAPTIINIDNSWGNKIATANKNFLKLSFVNKKADIFVGIKENSLNGLDLIIKCPKGRFNFQIPSLFGKFNAYNISNAIGLCFELGIYPETITQGLKTFTSVPGRMERYQLSNGAQAVIDYAHNPSSFEHVLPTMKAMTKQLIVVFGAGGERDKLKRPIMGKIASKIADKIIITSDNPRSEDPNEIINHILSGIEKEDLNKVTCVVDRFEAIVQAYKISKQSDIISILGKGPDEYQIIGNQKTYFSDKDIILGCK